MAKNAAFYNAQYQLRVANPARTGLLILTAKQYKKTPYSVIDALLAQGHTIKVEN